MDSPKDNSFFYTIAILIFFLCFASINQAEQLKLKELVAPYRPRVSWTFNIHKLLENIAYFEKLSSTRLSWTSSQKRDYLNTENSYVIDGVIDDNHDNKKRRLSLFDHFAALLETVNTTKRLTNFLKINLKIFTDFCVAFLDFKDKQSQLPKTVFNDTNTARHRRHKYNMMMTMIFGVVALGAILVPMGFQLLSVISGKALLLAKMALLLASINGLKRVANSGVHYGLYQVPGEPYYDRGGDVYHPRDLAHSVTASTPLDS